MEEKYAGGFEENWYGSSSKAKNHGEPKKKEEEEVERKLYCVVLN